jgi:hypothetical protein
MSAVDITFDMIKNAALVLVGLYGIEEIFSKIISKIGSWTKKEEKIATFDPEAIKKDIMDQYFADQQKKWANYNTKIAEIDQKIDDMKTDFETRNQEIKAELYLQTDCMQAVLDGLKQLECNGPVTEAKERLDDHILKRAYK